MTEPRGHVEPVPGAPQQQPQPRQTPYWQPQAPPAQFQPRQPAPAEADPYAQRAWGSEPPREDADGTRRWIDPPPLVIAAAVIALAVGGVLLVLALGGFDGSSDPLPALTRLVFPAILVAGGVRAFRGRRGALTTGAVFLLLTGVVLVVQLLRSDLYEPLGASIEATLRLAAGVLVIVFSRVPASTTFFETMQELRHGRRDADFFR